MAAFYQYFISKSIIEAHGGSIWASNNDVIEESTSAESVGATFGFSLPLDVA
jgi:signal transduction histidine kinase